MNKMNQLKDRVDAKKHELMAKLHDLRADGRSGVDDEKKGIQARLDELQEAIKDGWDKASDKLEGWLDRSDKVSTTKTTTTVRTETDRNN